MRLEGTSGDYLVQISTSRRISYRRLLRATLSGFECFQAWRIHNLFGQIVPCFDSYNKKVFSYY